MRLLITIAAVSTAVFFLLGKKSSDKPVEKPEKEEEIVVKKKDKSVIHIFTALCDRKNQGIAKANSSLENGQDPRTNQYWGALYGIKTYFKKSDDWTLLKRERVNSIILERLIFKHKKKDVIIIADAYNGAKIKQATEDFMNSLYKGKNLTAEYAGKKIPCGSNADLSIYVGHNGLMDFNLPQEERTAIDKECMIFCCKSRAYFEKRLEKTGAKPIVLTNGFMAPEAYVVKAAIDGWIAGDKPQNLTTRVAVWYHKYQKCGSRAAVNLFKAPKKKKK